MSLTVNDALQHLDALLSVEADALTNDELLLVTDMVQQLVGGSNTAAGQQQHLLYTPAGSNLAAQIEQMLPGVVETAQQQSQQPQPQTLSTAALTAQNLQYQGAQRAQTVGAAHLGFCSNLVLNSPNLCASLQATDASGLAEPSDSSISGRSSPVSPQSRPLTKFMGSLQHPAAARPAPAAPAQPDAAVQAAADVLTAALTDPNASIDEIVGIFDSVLTAGELDAKELQQRLASPQPHQQPVHVQYQQPLQHLQTQPLQPAQQQQHPAQDFQQQPPAQCSSPALAAGSKQSALNSYLQEQQHSHAQPVLDATYSAGSPPSRTPNSQGQPSSRLSMPGATEWHPDRPSTAPAKASSQYPASQAGSVSLRGSNHSALSTSTSTALITAAAARRSQSPDVFRRLSVMSTASATAKQAAVQMPPCNSNAAHEVQRNWAGNLRGDGEKSPQPARDRSSSRGRDSCMSEQQQQHSGEEVPWLTAAEVQNTRQSGRPMSPGPMEWDADSRSVKAGSAGGWVSSTRGRSPAHTSEWQQKDPAAPQKQPLKLPKHVIEERMRRFYARNVDWKNRCAQVYERQREQQKQGEEVECTFAPTINKKSGRMAQELRTSYPMKPIRPITPLAHAAQEVEQQLRKQQLLQQQRRSASTGKMRQKQQPQGWMYGSVNSCTSLGFGSSSSGGADQPIPPAAKRLFQDATVRMQRAEQLKEVTEQAERKARSWSAPRRPGAESVPPRVYDHLDPQRSSSKQGSQKHPPAYGADDACLFKPWTNPRRKPKPARSGITAAQEEHEADEAELEEFVAILAEQQQLQQKQQRPGTAPAGGRQQQPCSPRASRRIGSATKNADLDWAEFIDRQSMFIRTKKAKVAAVTDQEYSRSLSPELSPETKRILKCKQALTDNCGSPSYTCSGPYNPVSPQKQQDFLGRLQQESQSHASSSGGSPSVPESPGARRAGKASAGGSSTATSARSGNGSGGGWTSDEHTFKPRITPKAAAMKARSFEEMSEGDRLRREVRLEQLRVLKEVKELAGVTFRPDLSPSRQRAGESFVAVPPKISMTSEGLSAYMASLQEKRRQLEERRRKAQTRQQEEEIRECTFKPETTPVPAYITEMAEVGYTARYIDRVMQGALTDSRVGSTVAAVAKALKPSDGGRPLQETCSAGGSP